MKRVSGSAGWGGFYLIGGHGAKCRLPFFPSPLVGEGGSNERSEFETGEGFRSINKHRNPSSGTDFVRATFSHKGRREERVCL
jgi:hypothetical protein